MNVKLKQSIRHKKMHRQNVRTPSNNQPNTQKGKAEDIIDKICKWSKQSAEEVNYMEESGQQRTNLRLYRQRDALPYKIP